MQRDGLRCGHSGMFLGLQLALELFSKSIIAQTSLSSHGSYLDSKCQVDDPGTSEASHCGAPEHPLRRQEGRGNSVISHPNHDMTNN